jgi:hypothetical protein
MTKTTTIIAMIAGFTLTAETTRAQTPSITRSDPNMFLSVSGGGQLQSRTFSELTTFTLFNEAGTVTANQTVGKGFVFDASVGRRNVWRGISAVVGVSTFHGSGAAAAIVAVPNPLFFDQPTIKTFAASDYGDLGQTDIAVNFQALWMKPLTAKLDLSVFIGPSIIHVKQEVASATETQSATATIQSESATTGKAGTVGVDLSYRLNNRYSVGGFIRYAGGEVDLPSVSKLKVGGVQAAGGVRYRF